MKITKFKKYISWNLISLTGYLSMVIAIIFFIFFIIAASNLNMRADLNEFFYEYIVKHVINPYFGFYKTQITWICLLLIISIYEEQYYKKKSEFGLRIFENSEKAYSIMFFTGLVLNFLPLYMIFMAIVINFMKIR